MAQVVLQPKATSDMNAIYVYLGIQNHSPAAADRFFRDLDKRLAAYARQPRMGILCEDLGDDLRCFSFGKHYVVIYLPLHDGIEVLRMFHTARDYQRLFLEGR